MSKESKFHNLIEKSGQEEKKRVWGNIQAQDTSMPDQPKKKTRKFGFLFSRKFLSWSAAAALALILSIVGITQFIPDLIEANQSGGNQAGEMGSVSGDQDETQQGASASASDQSVPGSSQPDDTEIESAAISTPDASDDGMAEEDSQEPSAGIKYYGTMDYTKPQQEQNLKQLANGSLYFDWYENEAVITIAYVENKTQTVIAYEEIYTVTETDGQVNLWITAENVKIEELFDADKLDGVQMISGVTVRYGLTEQNGREFAYAYFIYEGSQYYVRATENVAEVTLTKEYLFALIEELLPQTY